METHHGAKQNMNIIWSTAYFVNLPGFHVAGTTEQLEEKLHHQLRLQGRLRLEGVGGRKQPRSNC